MKRIVSLSLIFIVLLAGVGCQQQSAPVLQPVAHQPHQDVYLVFQGRVFRQVTLLLPIRVVGEVAFKLQEGTHASIRDVSQAEIDYYYIWVCLEDACIPVDPFSYSN